MAEGESTSDEDLMMAWYASLDANSRDDSSVALVIARHQPDMMKHARSKLEGRHDQSAEDAVQVAWMKAFHPSPASRYDPARGVPLVAWLIIILNRTCIDILRKPDSRRLTDLVIDSLASNETRASDKLEADDRLARCLGQLSERSRKLVQHRIREGLKWKETAEKVGMKIPTAHQRLEKALLALKECMGAAPDPPAGRATNGGRAGEDRS